MSLSAHNLRSGDGSGHSTLITPDLPQSPSFTLVKLYLDVDEDCTVLLCITRTDYKDSTCAPPSNLCITQFSILLGSSLNGNRGTLANHHRTHREWSHSLRCTI